MADHEENPVVLRVDLRVSADGERRVCRTEGQVQEQLLAETSVGIDRIEVAIFTVGVDNAIRVDRGGVDAPLEPARMVVLAHEIAVVLVLAAQRVRAQEPSVDLQSAGRGVDGAAVQNADVVRSGRRDRAELLVVAVGAGVIVVVLLDDRIRAVGVREDRRCRIPPEVVGREERAGRTELEHVPAREVVAAVGAIKDAAIRRDGGR